MNKITTIGRDIAKNVFQLNGIDADGQVVLQKSLRRGQMRPFFEKLAPCLIGMEACATAHHWARTLIVAGHDVRRIPAPSSGCRLQSSRRMPTGRRSGALCNIGTTSSVNIPANGSGRRRLCLTLFSLGGRGSASIR